MSNPLTIGDRVVLLHCDQPIMTVVGVDASNGADVIGIHCGWFTADLNYCQAVFPQEALARVVLSVGESDASAS